MALIKSAPKTPKALKEPRARLPATAKLLADSVFRGNPNFCFVADLRSPERLILRATTPEVLSWRPPKMTLPRAARTVKLALFTRRGLDHLQSVGIRRALTRNNFLSSKVTPNDVTALSEMIAGSVKLLNHAEDIAVKPEPNLREIELNASTAVGRLLLKHLKRNAPKCKF